MKLQIFKVVKVLTVKLSDNARIIQLIGLDIERSFSPSQEAGGGAIKKYTVVMLYQDIPSR